MQRYHVAVLAALFAVCACLIWAGTSDASVVTPITPKEAKAKIIKRSPGSQVKVCHHWRGRGYACLVNARMGWLKVENPETGEIEWQPFYTELWLLALNEGGNLRVALSWDELPGWEEASL